MSESRNCRCGQVVGAGESYCSKECWRDAGAVANEEPAKTVCPVDGSTVYLGECCEACNVLAWDPCPACGEAMYHRSDCPDLDAPGNESAPYVDRA